MKILKKMTSLLAVGTMLFTWGTGVLPESVREKLAFELRAEAFTEGTYGTLTYQVCGDWVEITDCEESATKVSIPEVIDGVQVTQIGYCAFQGCTELIEVDIPESITLINLNAFAGCTALTSITIPDSVTAINQEAFYACTNLDTINISDGLLSPFCTSLGLRAFHDTAWYNNQPDGLVYLGSYLYGYKGNMPSDTKIVIKDGTLGIADGAFQNCANLKSIELPDSLLWIGAAFSNCTGLTSIDIPDSVMKIECSAFSGCSALSDINIPDNISNMGNAFNGTAWYENQPDGIVYAGKVAYGYKGDMPQNSALSLADGTLGIAYRAFCDRVNLISLDIPESVQFVGQSAFEGCENLKSITLPNGMTKINNAAFWFSDGWEEIVLPNSIEIIEDVAFYECHNLKSITIPSSVKKIEVNAFFLCESLTDVYYTGTEDEWNAITINSGNECLTNATIHYNYGASVAFGTINGLKWELTEEGVLTISGSGLMGLDGTTTAPWLAYADKITEVVIEDGVLDIGEAAFAGCTNLTSVTISDSVYLIRQGAFKNCTALTNITIPDGISEIPVEAFSGCTSLVELHIPRSLTAVEENAFSGCTALKDIYYGGIAADFSEISMDASAVDSLEEFLDLDWHYLDEYYYSDVDPKIYEQMRTLCDKPTYYGNSQTVGIVKDYRNMAIADPEVESYNWWSNFNDVLDGNLTEEEFSETMTVEALMTEIFLNKNLIDSFDRNTADAVWNANKEILTGLKMNASDWGISEDSIDTIDNLLSVADYSTEFVDESTMKVYSILMEVDGQKFSAFETMLRGLSENSKVIGDVGTCLDLFTICYEYHQSKVENAAQLYNLYLICVAYHSSSAQFQQAVQFMSDSVTVEMNKYIGDDEFAQRMRKVGAMYQEYYRIMLDESMTAYQDFAAELDAETEFNRNFQLATFGAKEIAIAAIGVACPYAALVLETAGLALDVGISLWEITTEVDERSLERDKFLNMILFYDSFSNALYSNEGFFGLLLDDPSETSYQTLVNGIQMYLVVEDMLLDYAVDYSVMLKRALKDWKNSTFSLVDVSLYVKDVYHARYPDRSTSGRTVNSCWKELNSDMSDDDAQLLRFNHVFIDNEEFTGLRHLYYLTDEEAQALGGTEYIRYLCLKDLVDMYTIFCPVDITILHGNEIVAKVENDTITLESDEIFLNIYQEADDEYAYKHVILPEGYTLEISGFATGTMCFEKATIENGSVTTISTITDVPVQYGSVYTEVIEDGITVALEYDQENDGVTDQTLTAEVTNVVTIGDVNSDGVIDPVDATLVLQQYSIDSMNGEAILDENQKLAANVNADEVIDPVDATWILRYYSYASMNGEGTIEDFIANN